MKNSYEVSKKASFKIVVSFFGTTIIGVYKMDNLKSSNIFNILKEASSNEMKDLVGKGVFVIKEGENCISPKLPQSLLNKLSKLGEAEYLLSPEEGDSMYDFALYACKDKELQKKLFKKVINVFRQTNKKRASLSLINLGVILVSENCFEEALCYFSEAEDVNPLSIEVPFNKACVYSLMGDYEKSFNYLNNLFELLKKRSSLEITSVVEAIFSDVQLETTRRHYLKEIKNICSSLVSSGSKYSDRIRRALNVVAVLVFSFFINTQSINKIETNMIVFAKDACISSHGK